MTDGKGFRSLFNKGWKYLASPGGKRISHPLLKCLDGSHAYSDYLDYWKSQVRQGGVISNGWAFSTWNGVAAYERHISTDERLKKLYRHRQGAITEATKCLRDGLKGGLSSRLGGVMIYGYGNLIREQQLIECLVSNEVLNKKPAGVFLLDGSIHYHLLAESKLNPIRQNIKPNRIQPQLIDFLSFNDDEVNSIRYMRDDLNLMMPALHVFFGNTFGNVTPENCRRLIEKYCSVGDFIICEYAKYPDGYFAAPANDYLTNLVKAAAAELFDAPKDKVETEEVATDDRKLVNVKVTESSSTLEFQTMLRRDHNSADLTVGTSTCLVKSFDEDGATKIDLYKVLPTG